MQEKKILLVIQNLGGGGAEKVFVHLANGFVAEGHETWLLLGAKKGVYFDILNDQVKVRELNANSLLSYYKKLPIFLNENNFTHVFTASDYISAVLFYLKKKNLYTFKFIATLHYDLPVQLSILPKLNKFWLTWLNKTFIAKADELVSVSKGVGHGFEQIVGKGLKNLQTIYNPVFSERIYSLANQPLTVPLLGEQNIISIGRFAEQKAHRTLLEAFLLLHKKLPKLHLYLLGEGPLRKEIENFVLKNNLNQHVHFMGFQSNPYKFLSKVNVLVLSSIYECLGNVIIEALALGVNVVSTDCPSGPAEILKNGEFGWLSPVHNSDAIARNIEEALAHPKSTKILKDRAVMFSEPIIIKQYLKLLD